jgi:hypothetical protein
MRRWNDHSKLGPNPLKPDTKREIENRIRKDDISRVSNKQYE